MARHQLANRKAGNAFSAHTLAFASRSSGGKFDHRDWDWNCHYGTSSSPLDISASPDWPRTKRQQYKKGALMAAPSGSTPDSSPSEEILNEKVISDSKFTINSYYISVTPAYSSSYRANLISTISGTSAFPILSLTRESDLVRVSSHP